ncbi:MAG: MMPL family transporter, partial [Pseudomonadota bacterium]
LMSAAAALISLAGALQLRYVDDVAALFETSDPAAERLVAYQSAYVDPAERALLLVSGPLDTEAGRAAAEALEAAAAAHLGADAVATPFGLEADAAKLRGELSVSTPFGRVSALERRERPPLMSADGDRALFLLALPEGAEARAAVTALRAALAPAITAAAAAGVEAQLTGAPPTRATRIDRLVEQQPLLLACGLVIGFLFGAFLLGSVIDAAVVAVAPILCLLMVYGAFGWSGTPMTALLNNLPLLILALAFTTHLHLVFDARRRLCLAEYREEAIAGALREVGPACALSLLTTMLAFAAFVASGSSAIMEFGAIGAAAVGILFLTAMIAHPAIVWAALRLGWRPEPVDTRRADGLGWRTGPRMLEKASVALALPAFRRARLAAVATAALLIAAAAAHLSLPTQWSALEDIPEHADERAAALEIDGAFSGSVAISLPLPIALEGEGRTDALIQLKAAHEAAAAEFGAEAVFSAWTPFETLKRDGRRTLERLGERLIEALPPALAPHVISAEGARPSVIALSADGSAAEIAARAAALEAAVGAAIGRDLEGAATGAATAAARVAPAVIERLNLGLLAAAVASSLIAALAFRSWAAFACTFAPNLLPVLFVGAALWASGGALGLAPVLAMTIAFGVAVDDSVHMAGRFRLARRDAEPELAMLRAAKEVGPVLIATTLVLALGLAPALLSWSPAIATFAAFAIATIAAALLADLLTLPPLLRLTKMR